MDASETVKNLMTAVCADPSDDTVRLILADALDEQPLSGTMTCPKCKGNRGEGKREYKEFGGEERWWEKCPKCDGTGTVADTANRDRAELIRVQCELARTPLCGGGDIINRDHCGSCRRVYALRHRERELLDRHRADWSRLRCPVCKGSGGRIVKVAGGYETERAVCLTCGGTGDLFRRRSQPGEPAAFREMSRTVTFSRGFIESVSCTLDEVITPNGGASEWARAVVRSAPVVKFVAQDAEAWRGNSGAWYALSPDIRECPVSRDVWHEIHSDGGYLTEEAAEDALAWALGRLVRAEVYGKAVPA